MRNMMSHQLGRTEIVLLMIFSFDLRETFRPPTERCYFNLARRSLPELVEYAAIDQPEAKRPRSTLLFEV